jgi:hypothetical protein
MNFTAEIAEDAEKKEGGERREERGKRVFFSFRLPPSSFGLLFLLCDLRELCGEL